MSNNSGPIVTEAPKSSFHTGERRYFLMVLASIVVAGCLVVVALMIYNRSGAAQLDLSRPGYSNETRKQASSVKQDFTAFPNKGPLDAEAYEQFTELYKEQSHQTIGANAFGDDVLTNEALDIKD